MIKFVLFIFLVASNGEVGVFHKAYASKESCEEAQATVKKEMKVPEGTLVAASKCISEKDLLEYELT